MKKWIPLFLALQICMGCAKPKNNANDSPDIIGNDDDSAEELIIGGHAVTKKSEIAAVTVSLLNVREGTLCTASLLSDEIALTAAHCVDGSADDLQLSFGTRSTSNESRPVEAFAVPPVWRQQRNAETNNGDIALIKFSGGLPASAHAATLMPGRHRLTNGEIVTLAGFGISNGASDTGAGTLRSVDIKIANANFSKTEVSLDQTHKKGACHGDSGGPAFIQGNNGELLLWGVTSRGINDPDDHCRGDSVYTKIQPYVRWMNATLRGWR